MGSTGALMHQGVKALEDTSSMDELAWLVLRVVSELSPCTKRLLLAFVSGSDSTSSPGHAYGSAVQERISKALLKLKALALIHLADEKIVITDEGRRLLGDSPMAASPPRTYLRQLKHFYQSHLARAVTQQRLVTLGGVFLVVGLLIAWSVTSLSNKQATEKIVTLKPREASRDADQDRFKVTAAEPSSAAQDFAEESGTPLDFAEQRDASPIVATIRRKLSDPALQKGVVSDDFDALKSYYDELSGPPVWTTGRDFSTRAKGAIDEIAKADDWGLSAKAFDLPLASDVPTTTESQAIDEIKLGLAILKYARFAKGGRLRPSRISSLFDQQLHLLNPKTLLTEIAASEAPDAYLRSLHPQHESFGRLREALRKARAKSEAGDKKKTNEREVQLLLVNMERWRWMPAELGSYYVWNNVPEFITRVVKGDKTIYAEKTIVGQPKYATPIFSATMRSIVFHPEWVVPETVIKEDLQPALQHGGLFGGPDTSILRQHKLKVSYKGRPVDADTVNWASVNIRQYTFTQPPGSDNVLGVLKFNFPNKHAVYMHDTIEPELFAKPVRTFSHGCIRVHQPDRLAALLLAEDKGWSVQAVKRLLAKGSNKVVPLSRPIPVHLTYFTTVVDENGKVETFTDIYGLDSRMASALLGKAGKVLAPMIEAKAQDVRQRRKDWRSIQRSGRADAISGLFGN